MKIGVLIDRLNVGGVEKIALEQVRALRDIGEDAYLVILRKKAVVDNAFPDLVKRVPIIYLDERLPSFLRFSFQFPMFHFFSSFHVTYPFFIPFILKKKEFDYFIVHGTYTAFSAIAIRKTKKIPFATFIWDPISYILGRVYNTKLLLPLFWILTKIAIILDTQIINNSDVILVGGDAHNKIFAKLNSKKKIAIIYPSVHPIKKQVKKSDYILMVTAWKTGKNPEYIFEIIKRIPEIKIKMAGKWLDKEYQKVFYMQVEENKMRRNIEILGEVTENQLSKLYAEALVVLQTNDDRGFGLPALEAAGHGTTFIIPQGQGVCKLFRNGKDGYFTKEKYTKKIVDLLHLFLSEQQKAKKMGEYALQTVKEHYSWKKHAFQLKKIVEENSE